ncbi:MAG: hypothetical protein IJZ82_10495 [Lachnospiraceae bacterium]|nr:hypothetical protein [Lachnospiraceae bacterium]
MEYIVFFAAFGCFVLFVYVQGKLYERRYRRWFTEKVKGSFGKLPEKTVKIERFVRIPTFYWKHPQEGQIDDITWNDLDMDEVFQRMDYTYSSTGQEYLYYLLRTPNTEDGELEYLDKVVDYYMEHEKERVEIQLLMNDLGSTGKYSLYDYLDNMDSIGDCSNKKELLVNGLYIVFALCLFFYTQVGIIGLVAIMMYQIITYTGIKKHIDPYLTSIGYILRLMHISGKVKQTGLAPCPELVKNIDRAKLELTKGSIGSSIMMYNSKQEAAKGSPLDVLIDYVKMAFHIDIIIFNRTIKNMRRNVNKIDALCIYMGFLDAAISIGMFRASLENGYCKPKFAEGAMEMKELYHPLLSRPVKNSLTTDKAVLLTGSNASGKSTFLRSVALGALLGQTVYTVCADSFQMPFFRLYSSMSLKDSIEGGDSYYMAEIKAIKRVLDGKKRGEKILCFLDEVLRGTNTVERISASSQILKNMAQEGIVCFAATHDIELTELLKDYYDNYHFDEEVADGDVSFSYLLKEGKATTRNAIKLLQIMGYEEDIIAKANAQAEHFTREGIWKLT